MEYRSQHLPGGAQPPPRPGSSWHPQPPGGGVSGPGNSSLPPYAGQPYPPGPGPNGSGPSSGWQPPPASGGNFHSPRHPAHLPPSQHSSPGDGRNDSQRSDGHSAANDEKRKRIQQACKSCGLKRVKCDGLKPCQTCKRTGEVCEYGQPKKRGPPKGSTRGPSKKHREMQATAATAADNAASPPANGSAKRPRNEVSASSTPNRPPPARHPIAVKQEAPQPPSPSADTLPPIGGLAGIPRPPVAAPTPASHDEPVPFRLRSQRSPGFETGPSSGQGSSAYLPPLHPRAPRETFHYLGESSGMGVVSGNPPSFAGSLPLRRRPPGGPGGAWKLSDMGSPRSSSVAGFTSPAAFCLSSSATAPSSPAASGSIHSPPSFSSSSQWSAGPGPGVAAGLDPRSKPRTLSSTAMTAAPTSQLQQQQQTVKGQGGPSRPFHRDIIPWHETFEEPAFADAALATVYRERRRALRHAEEGGKRRDADSEAADEALAAAGIRPQSSAGQPGGASDRSSSPDEMPGVALHEPRIPASVVSTLMTIFWSLVFPHWPILYTPGFGPLGPDQLPTIREEDHPLLFNAMCAFTALAWDPKSAGIADGDEGQAAPDDGGRNSSNHTPMPRTAAELSTVYFIRARYYLLRSNNESSEETAAALIFMSLHQSGGGRSVQAAQYASTACRMALDLGLHRHLEVSRSHSFTHAEDQARRRLFWGCYVLDKVSAAELGRPPVLRDIETDCPEPSLDEPDELMPLPPGAWSFFRTETTEAIRQAPVRPATFQLACIELGRIVETILAGYNANKAKLDVEGRSEEWSTSTLRIHNRLTAWGDRWARGFLDLDRAENQLPHFLAMVMWYHCSFIILHRPHILKTSDLPGLPPSHAVCTEATRQICRHLAMYDRLFAVRKLSSTIVYCLFTASTISIANTTSDRPEVAAEAKTQLRQFMAWLSQISQTWSTASHHLVILEKLGQGIYADLDGTGLEGSGAALPEVDGGGGGGVNGGGPPRPVSRAALDRVGGGNGISMPSSASTPSHSDVGVGVGGAPADDGDSRSYHAAANAYWSCMPYGSEDVSQWNLFTNNYLDAFSQLNSQAAAAAAAPKRFNHPQQHQAGVGVGGMGVGIGVGTQTRQQQAEQQQHGGTAMQQDELTAFGTVKSGDPVRDTARWNDRPDTLLAALGGK